MEQKQSIVLGKLFHDWVCQVLPGDHKSESESLTLSQCDAFTDDVPYVGLFIRTVGDIL